jgi:hypothetical protein
MNRPNVTIHDTETNEVIERPMTDDEFNAFKAKQKLDDAKAVEADTKANEKAALLDRLGITADEAKLLLG